jgi:asparagine synthase (glutamine-hydrolysing)
MHFSIESRVPFLTPDLANLFLSMPEDFLISQQGQTKHIFRAAMRQIVPNDVLDRKDKVGFSTPEKDLLFGMAGNVRSWLKEDLKLPFLCQQTLLKEFDAMLLGQKPYTSQIWRWVNFIRWYTFAKEGLN